MRQDHNIQSDLLIADPTRFPENPAYRVAYLGDVNSNVENVHVLVVNAKTAEEIPQAIEKDRQILENSIANAKNDGEAKKLKPQLDYITNLQSMVGEEAYIKIPHSSLMEQISNNLRKPVKSKDVLYISGLST